MAEAELFEELVVVPGKEAPVQQQSRKFIRLFYTR
jgi:hypothetical protein